jgi:hypothetical protein
MLKLSAVEATWYGQWPYHCCSILQPLSHHTMTSCSNMAIFQMILFGKSAGMVKGIILGRAQELAKLYFFHS